MFNIENDKNRDHAEIVYLAQVLLMKMGKLVVTISLNGGREARHDQIEYWKEYAKNRDLPFTVKGGSIVELGRLVD